MKNKNKSSKVSKFAESLKAQALSGGNAKEKRMIEEAAKAISKKQVNSINNNIYTNIHKLLTSSHKHYQILLNFSDRGR